MIPTTRTYLLMLIGLPLALGLDLIGGHGLSFGGLAIWNLSLMGIAMRDQAKTRAHRIQIKRKPLGRLSLGRPNPIELEVVAGSKSAQIHIRDSLPASCECSDLRLSAWLKADQTDCLTYTVTPSQRGEFEWGSLAIRQRSLWGLVWDQWVVPQSQVVSVYPDLLGLKALSIRLAQQSAGSLRRSRQMGLGTEFAELRDYVRGDDPRLVDWKATARRLRPFVRVLEPEHEQTLIILLDRGRLMTAHVQGLTRFDWGLNSTLALALAGLQRGDQVGVGVFDRTIHTWIPPQQGPSHLNYLIERLTPIQPDWIEPDYFKAATSLVQRQPRRALVVLITDIIDVTASAEMLAALMRLTPRYLAFCVALRDPRIDHQAHTPTPRLATAYNRAVALDLLSQRQQAMSQLQQKGVLILDAPADQISTDLVDRYLQLKLYNRL